MTHGSDDAAARPSSTHAVGADADGDARPRRGRPRLGRRRQASTSTSSPGIAVNSLGHAHPVFVEAVARAGGDARARLELLRDRRRSSSSPSASRASPAPATGACTSATPAPRRTRPRSSWPGCTAATAPAHPRARGRVPRPHHGLARAHRQAAHAGAVPAADCPASSTSPATIEALEAALDDRRRGARSSSRSRARPASSTCPTGYLAGRARAHRASTARCSSSTRSRPAPAARGSGSPSSTPASRPDAITVAKGIGGGFPIGALVTFGAASDLFDAGHARLDLRRQPARDRDRERGARRDRARRAGRERRRARRAAARARSSRLDSPLVAGRPRPGPAASASGCAEPVANGGRRARPCERGLIINARERATASGSRRRSSSATTRSTSSPHCSPTRSHRRDALTPDRATEEEPA